MHQNNSLQPLFLTVSQNTFVGITKSIPGHLKMIALYHQKKKIEKISVSEKNQTKVFSLGNSLKNIFGAPIHIGH